MGERIEFICKKNKNKIFGNWNRVKKVMGVLLGVKMLVGSLVCVYIWGKGFFYIFEKIVERFGSWWDVVKWLVKNMWCGVISSFKNECLMFNIKYVLLWCKYFVFYFLKFREVYFCLLVWFGSLWNLRRGWYLRFGVESGACIESGRESVSLLFFREF